MKKIMLVLGICFVLFGNSVAFGQENNTRAQEQMHVALDLRDGSHILGLTPLKILPVHTSFGKCGIPLNLIDTVSFRADKETAVIKFLNGDTLQGVAEIASITLVALFGKTDVSVADIDRIQITASTPNKPKGLLLYYDFEDAPKDRPGAIPADESPVTIEDKSGNRVPARIFGSPRQVEGISGKGIEFTGRDYLEVVSNPTKGLDRLSVSLWFKTTNPGQNYKLITTATWPPGSGWTVGTHYAEMWDATGKNIITSFAAERKATFLPNQWNQFVAVYDGSSVIEYVNGEVSRKSTAIDAIIGDGGRLQIGAWTMYSAYNFVGTIDEVKVFNYPLSTEEIKQMYNLKK